MDHFDEIAKCARDVNYFTSKYVFKNQPYAWHGRVQELFDVGRRVVLVAGARQVGKTQEIIGRALHTALFKDRAKVFVTTFSATATKDFHKGFIQEFESLPEFLKIDHVIRNFNRSVEFYHNESSVIFTHNKHCALRGTAIDFLACDEFASYSAYEQRELLESALPAVCATNGKILLATLPIKNTPFDKVWQENPESRILVTWNDIPEKVGLIHSSKSIMSEELFQREISLTDWH